MYLADYLFSSCSFQLLDFPLLLVGIAKLPRHTSATNPDTCIRASFHVHINKLPDVHFVNYDSVANDWKKNGNLCQ